MQHATFSMQSTETYKYTTLGTIALFFMPLDSAKQQFHFAAKTKVSETLRSDLYINYN
jgi:hypothetical protein